MSYKKIIVFRVMSDWINNIVSAWKGHRLFAEWLVKTMKAKTIVELGVDYGFSTFCFANALQGTDGIIYGIDLFQGDEHTSFRNTYNEVLHNIKVHNVKNIEILRGDFVSMSKIWTKPIDILHIDGLHTYEAVKNDFECWSKHLNSDGIVLFHDVAIEHFGVKDFFKELSDGYRLYFTHSAGLGIYTKNKDLYKLILDNFGNIYEFDKRFL